MSAQRSAATTVALAAIVALFVGLSCVGITWGLPSRRIDPFLFGDAEPWSGERIHRLSRAGEKFSARRGADVDADPLRKSIGESIPLTATEEDVAKIYLRYRLYTYQPDEMITMMALAGMRPSQGQFDPRLYQYGGLFIYPVGALTKLCGIVGLIDVRSDIVFYLDNPDEFGKFYVVARAYSAAWGVLGIVIVFGIARRLRGDQVGLLAALLFALLPVVACMSHEGKPHLPGAVLMLAAVYFAMRWVRAVSEEEPLQPRVGKGGMRSGGSWAWVGMCICCGAAVGMVLSSWPIMVLIPLVGWVVRGKSRMVGGAHSTDRGNSSAVGEAEQKGPHSGPYDRGAEYDRRTGEAWASAFGRFVRRVACGTAIALAVYCVTNPYVVINVFVNREVLRSNFGNSLAMYQVARVWEGFERVVELTIGGATLPVVVLGGVACLAAAWRRNRIALVLVIPAVLFFLQFVMIGAGKPAEYGRFGIFYEAALVIGAACCLLPRPPSRLGVGSVIRWVAGFVVTAWAAWFTGAYLWNFAVDVSGGSRLEAIQELEHREASGEICKFAVSAEPAPYCSPPVAFDRRELVLDAAQAATMGSLRSNVKFNCSYRMVDGDLSLFPSWPKPTNDRVSGKDPWWIRLSESLWADCDTPISWGNKPIELTTPGEQTVIRGHFGAR